MSKTKIEFDYEGTEYCLEYTADSIKRLEKSGFSFGKIEDNLINCTEELFYGAFLANHKNTPRKVKEKIFAALSMTDDTDEEQITEVLFEMVNEAIESLKPSGNLKWKKSN